MKKNELKKGKTTSKEKTGKIGKINRFFIIGSVFLLFVVSATIITIALITRKTNIAFYNVPELQQNAIVNIIEENFGNSQKKLQNDSQKTKKTPRKKINAISLDETIPLSEQTQTFKKAKIIFAVMDSDTKNFALTNKIVQKMPEELLSGMSTSVSKSIPKENGSVFYVPLLYDMYQIDINYNFFLDSTVSSINIWKDLVNFGNTLKTKVYTPAVIPFCEDKEFINIFGQLLEAFSSPEEYQTFYKNLNTAANNKKDSVLADFLEKELADENSTAFKTLAELKLLLKKEIIKKSILSQNLEENLFYADNQICGIFFTKLSDHRKIDRTVINNYKSIYFPSKEETDHRKFCAYQYAAISLSKNKRIAKIMADLSSTLQTELSTKTGLAPVQKNCSVPDQQADDVRYWIAASQGAFYPLSCAIPSKEAQTKAAAILREKLE